MRVRLRASFLLPGLIAMLLPGAARAQSHLLNDTRRSTEIGIFHEWFHRQLEPSIYEDTRWNITSIQLSYCATDWLGLGLDIGTSEFESEDFPDSKYNRYSVGANLGVRALRLGAWDFGVSGRYLDTFDLDTSPTLLHKRVRSLGVTASVARTFNIFNQSTSVWAGPTVVDDFIETFAWDSTDALESTSGPGWGAEVGARVILGGWVALYGFASYVDDVQGGIGLSLHAGKGSL
jgi:hypothetical protein